MIDHRLRNGKRRLLRPVAVAIGGVPPASLTLAAFLAGLAAATAAFLGAAGPALAGWCLNRLLDGLDGEVARHRDRQSDLGGYLDLLADLAVYALLPIGLAAGHPAAGVWAALAAMLAAFYLNAGSWMLLSALLEKHRRDGVRREATSVPMPTGLVEGAETIVLFTLFLLFPEHLVWLFGAAAALVAATALQRTPWAVAALRDARSRPHEAQPARGDPGTMASVPTRSGAPSRSLGSAGRAGRSP